MANRKVTVAHRSGFDKTYRNSLTAHVGTLVPLFFDEVIPDTKVNLKINLAAALPPLVSDTYMNVRLRVEAFAVPHRILMGNFEDFFSDYPSLQTATSEVIDGTVRINPTVTNKGCVPLIRLLTDDSDFLPVPSLNGNGSLCDYLDLDVANVTGNSSFDVNVLPFVAYHLIWQEWYRNPRVQKPAFAINSYNNTAVSLFCKGFEEETGILLASGLPFVHCFFGDDNTQPTIHGYYDNDQRPLSEGLNPYLLADGTNILSLRQRNFDLDYFTGAMVEPQQGPMAEVAIEDGKFTIASLRAQNSIQQFRERNNLTSPRYNQQVYARYGVSPSDSVLQRPVLIGAASYDVYSHGVTQTSPSSIEGANPFGEFLGSRGGNAFASGSDFIIKNFHAKEPMYIMVLCSLVPEVTYAQGISRIFTRYRGVGSISDMANHMLQNVGPQAIKVGELYSRFFNVFDVTFAYTDRYADWMIKRNMVHGEFRGGTADGTLSNFVLQRDFEAPPEFGSEFLEIPKNYLDDVMQVTSENMKFGYWLDSMLEYRCSMPLRAYCIPSLQDPAYEHGKSISIRANGQIL